MTTIHRWACAIGTLAVVLGSAGATAQSRWHDKYFPNVELTTQSGERVHFYDLIKGRTVAIELIYTSCQFACPLETARLAQVQKLLGDRMGKDIFFYSISIDPKESAPILKGVPAFRNFTSNFSILLKDGQSAQYASATDPVSGETLKVDVTLNVLK